MKPRNREINIFNLSMLDVISGALGAVLIVLVMLFPYFGKDRTETEYQELQDKVEELEKDAKAGRIRNPFVVITEWRTLRHDVDMFLDDGSPRAQGYDPSRKNVPYWQGDVGTEHGNGPGQEIWLIRDVPAGEYKIRLNLFDHKGNPEPARVDVFMLYGEKFTRLGRGIELGQEKTSFLLGSISMDDNKNLTFQGATPELQRQYEAMQ